MDEAGSACLSTLFVERALGIITPDALTYEPGKKCFMCGSGLAVFFMYLVKCEQIYAKGYAFPSVSFAVMSQHDCHDAM